VLVNGCYEVKLFKYVLIDLLNLEPQGPCVLFATPGMLHGGASLEAFKAWAGSPLILVILPGYQVRVKPAPRCTSVWTL
jgi:hypothetical protein